MEENKKENRIEEAQKLLEEYGDALINQKIENEKIKQDIENIKNEYKKIPKVIRNIYIKNKKIKRMINE